MRRLEIALLGAGLACWSLALLYGTGALAPPASLLLPPRGLFALAAALGFLCGNGYVARSRDLPRPARRVLLGAWFLPPPGLLFLLHALEPLAAQRALPIGGLLASGVFAVLFLVPVSLRNAFSGR